MSRLLVLPTTVVASTILMLLCGGVDGTTTPTPPMTESEAIAEQQRLQKIHTYVRTVMNAKIQEHLDKSIANAANWTAAGCASSSFNGCNTAWSICCDGSASGTPPFSKKYACDDVDGFDDCIFNCEDTSSPLYSAARCTVAGFEGASVCGTDSAGNEVPAWPMTKTECSTGPTHELEGKFEVNDVEYSVPVQNLLDDVNANTASAHVGNWSKAALSNAVLTNAANVTSRSTVTFLPSTELGLSFAANNNGKLIVNGSWKTHFFAVDPTNYGTGAALGDGLSILGGDVTVLGANSSGALNSTTNGTTRMLNIESSGNVNSKGTSDMFMANVQSSGNVVAEATSDADKRVLYNVTALGGEIQVLNGLSALYSVTTMSGAVVTVTGGSHFVSNTTNAGTMTMSGCTYANLYNVVNSGNVTAACTTVVGRMLANNGGFVKFTQGDLDVVVSSNTGTVEISTGVTGNVTIPYGTAFSAPSTVTVTYTGMPTATSSSSSSRSIATSAMSSDNNGAAITSGSVTTSGPTSGSAPGGAFDSASFSGTSTIQSTVTVALLSIVATVAMMV